MPGSPRSSESGHGHGYRNGADGDLQKPPITISSPPETPMVNLTGRRPSLRRNDSTELMLKRLKEALSSAADRGVEHVKLDRTFVEAIVSAFENKSNEVIEMAGKLDGMKVRTVLISTMNRGNNVYNVAREPDDD
jgi:fructose-1-phosphate kinase PfkB-like protein